MQSCESVRRAGAAMLICAATARGCGAVVAPEEGTGRATRRHCGRVAGDQARKLTRNVAASDWGWQRAWAASGFRSLPTERMSLRQTNKNQTSQAKILRDACNTCCKKCKVGH